MWSVKSGVLVEQIGCNNIKVYCPNLFICGVAADVFTNVGNDPCVVPNGNSSYLCRNNTGVVPYTKN